ncbi:hypothetical protein M2375_000900 [Comamonas sp. BIGb0152]|nr:hypothetical protein [Comamonas sp. BIGb0152]
MKDKLLFAAIYCAFSAICIAAAAHIAAWGAF